MFVESRGPGSLIGELAALRDSGRRSATAVSRHPETEAYCFSLASIEGLACEDRAAVWRGLAGHVAEKLASAVPLRVRTHLIATERGEQLRKLMNAEALNAIYQARHGTFIQREAVIWFSDLVGFSRIASEAAPEAVASALSEAMSAQCEAIHASGGHIDKFMGDGLMAFWLPDSTESHERQRVANAAIGAAFQARFALAAIA